MINSSPAQLEIWNHRLAQVAEEMGVALGRAAFSPNIKERRDYSCALFDAVGRLVAQAAHIPVHLGATALSLGAVLQTLTLADGEVAIVNDPYAGGTHLPDITLVRAVFASGELIGYVANRAHHADVGGGAPGSMPMGVRAVGDGLPEAEETPVAMGPQYAQAPSATLRTRPVTIDEEGVRIPPSLLDDAVVARLCAASTIVDDPQARIRPARAPDERRGDLAAQRAALEVGCRRLQALAATYGADVLRARGDELIAYGEALLRAAIRAIPDGVYAFADSLDDDGAGTHDVGVRVLLHVQDDRVVVDFSDSDGEVLGPLNAVYAVTLSAVVYAFRLLLPNDAPTNHGLYAPLEVIAPDGSIVNANPPRAVAAGNVETSQRIVDVVLGALAQALPGRIPAASSGTMSNVLLGDDERAYYETIGGGAGASADGPGASCLHTHMTNTRNTPIEALEHALPVRVVRYQRRRGSGGGGQFAGGDGVVRELELGADLTVTIVGERRRRPPYGLMGGGPGIPGEDWIERGDQRRRLPPKVTFAARKGDRLTIATPGGGGYGDTMRAKFWASILSGEALKLD
ncbi:MAG TPA: hydantoinase B/oxoprolinase family protein [Polyangia bacterium]|nr:hydantoinase B/oxoprolinase family protein [Polyangia bacterium]